MFRKLIIAAAAAAFTLSAAAQATPSVDEILAKNIEAKGGLEKLKSVNSVRLLGKMEVGPGIEAPMVIEQKRPDKVRLDITVQGLTASQAYDGQVGWQIMPFQGKKDPEPMGEDDLKQAKEQADFDGPLMDYKAKGHTIEYVGKEPVEGSDAHKLKVTLKDGDIRYFYIDADAFLETKIESKRTIRGTERETETMLGDYKEVEGMMVPHSFVASAKGSPQKQKMTIDKVEVNPEIADSRFTMPEVKKEAPPAAKPEEKKPEGEKKPEAAK